MPRFNNPSGVFDNDQYQYKIYVKCDDTASQVAKEDFLQGLQAWAEDNGNNLPIEENAVW